MTTPESVQQAAERLHAARPEATIILFGSRARGDARPDSDVDFMVVLPQAPASPRHEMVVLSDLLRPLRVWADGKARRRGDSCSSSANLVKNVRFSDVRLPRLSS